MGSLYLMHMCFAEDTEIDNEMRKVRYFQQRLKTFLVIVFDDDDHRRLRVSFCQCSRPPI